MIGSIRHHKETISFLLSTNKDNKMPLPCKIRCHVTRDWFARHFDRSNDVFKGCLVCCKGNMYAYSYLYKGVKCKTVAMDVQFIEFLDFKPNGRNTLDNPKFYDRHLLDWERYFNKNEF
jgi:hypothetical protein